MAPAEELVRVGHSPERGLYLGAGAGRGAWWCDESTCRAAVRTSHIARALRREIDANEFARLVAHE